MSRTGTVRRRATSRRVAVAVVGVLSALLAVALLWPDGRVVNRAVVAVYVFSVYHGIVPPEVTPEHYAAALNVLAFVPLGWLGVAVLRRPAVLVVLVLAGLSALVELVQLSPLLQREASLVDVLCNAGGAVLGALLGSLVGQDARRDEVVDEGRDRGGDDLG